MARIHVTIEGCINQIRKAVYAVEPAAIDGMGKRWHAHSREAGDMLKAGESVRLFDVVCEPSYSGPVTFGSTTNDYDITVNIVICYGMNENYNHLAAADYDNIMYSLHNINVGDVPGLNFYIVQNAQMTETEDARFVIIPVLCRISAERS